MNYVRSTFLRSFFIQSAWSFERMQSLGFYFSIFPSLRSIHTGKEELKDASRRHLEFFNTNPYMAPAIMGATIRLEQEKATEEEIRGVKEGLMGAYGAVGDALFWGALRPLAGVVGVIAALYGIIWAPVIFLLVFNLPHLFMRYYGLSLGYRLGTGVVSAIRDLRLPDIAVRIKEANIFLSGVLFSLVPHYLYGSEGRWGNMSYLFLMPLTFLFYMGMEKGIRIEVLAVLGVALSFIYKLIS